MRTLLIIVALALPMASLIGLGVVWLWQGGYMVYWAMAALGLSVSVYGFELWMLRRGAGPAEPKLDPKPDRIETSGNDEDIPDGHAQPEPSWTPIEQEAWQKVMAIARERDPASLTDRRAVLDLGRQTLETVARTLHPNDKDPLLRFTLPEALALVERVSGELRPFVIDSIPLGDQITLAQAMRLYRWKSVAGLAGNAYDIWRIIRVMNPVTAATQELREQVSKKLMGWGREALARKLMQKYVEEVGRAAIDLYGGRLVLTSGELAQHVTRASQSDLQDSQNQIAEPLRILVAGQVGVGKSSIVNALIGGQTAPVDVLPLQTETTAHELTRDHFPAALLLDAKGLTDTPDILEELVETTTQCDMILYVIDATRVDRHLDVKFLRAVREKYAQMVDRRPPPVLVVINQIDRLRPFKEWSPPYDMSDTSTPKVKSILAARDAVAKDLEIAKLEITEHDIIPACLDIPPLDFNIDAIWAELEKHLPQARSAQLVRSLAEAGADGFSFRKVMSQARGAGRAAAKTLRR